MSSESRRSLTCISNAVATAGAGRMGWPQFGFPLLRGVADAKTNGAICAIYSALADFMSVKIVQFATGVILVTRQCVPRHRQWDAPSRKMSGTLFTSMAL